MSERNNSNNEEHILCKDIKSLSTFKDKIIFRKHTKRINHIDLQKYLLMTSGDDDLIIIIDLFKLKYVLQYYDIINGTSFCRFLEPIMSTKIIYYGSKSYKLYIYEYSKKSILLIVNLLRENLYHLEYNNKSNLFITSQESNCVIWKLNENLARANYKFKNSYYAIIIDDKRQIISASRKKIDDKVYSYLSVYNYDNNRDLTIIKDRDVDLMFDYDIKEMNYYKNPDNYFLITMSDFFIDFIKLDDDTNSFHLSLSKKKDLRFSYFETSFVKELIIGYNNGIVEILNPFWDKEQIKDLIDEKYNQRDNINKLLKDISRNEPKHEENVVQIKLSDYYPFYVSISNEMIIYQLKE